MEVLEVANSGKTEFINTDHIVCLAEHGQGGQQTEITLTGGRKVVLALRLSEAREQLGAQIAGRTLDAIRQG